MDRMEKRIIKLEVALKKEQEKMYSLGYAMDLLREKGIIQAGEIAKHGDKVRERFREEMLKKGIVNSSGDKKDVPSQRVDSS